MLDLFNQGPLLEGKTKRKKAFLIFATLSALVCCKEDFRYVRKDGKSVMYTVSNVTMPWIQSSKVHII